MYLIILNLKLLCNLRKMDWTPTKKVIDEIFYQDVRNQLKKLKSEVNQLMLRMTREIGVDYIKRLLMDSSPLIGIYDMLEDLLTTASDPNEANDNSIINIIRTLKLVINHPSPHR